MYYPCFSAMNFPSNVYKDRHWDMVPKKTKAKYHTRFFRQISCKKIIRLKKFLVIWQNLKNYTFYYTYSVSFKYWFKKPLTCVGIFGFFQIKNLRYLAFRQFHLHGDFRGQSLQFYSFLRRKNSAKNLPETTSKWERLRCSSKWFSLGFFRTDLASSSLGLYENLRQILSSTDPILG